MFTTWEYKKEPEEYLEKSNNGEETIQTTRMHIKTKYLKCQRKP
jgi:hypothetical protein